MTRPQQTREFNEAVERVLRPLESVIRAAPEAGAATRNHYAWYRRMFDLGAVSSAALLDVRMTSTRVKRMESKAVTETFNLADETLLDIINSRNIQFGAGLSKGIIEDVRKLIKDLVFIRGLSLDEVLDRMRGYSLPTWRALRIALTETQQAYNIAAFEMYKRSGVEYHSWLTVGDRRVRPQHTDNEAAGIIKVGDYFPSGQLHPGDGALSINCRCALIPEKVAKDVLLKPWDGSGGFYTKQDI